MSPTMPAMTITPTLRRRRGLAEQAAVAAVDQDCRRLRLPTVRAALDEALIVAYGRVDLLCIDELGYIELNRRGAELLFQVLAEREEKNSIAIASNESFSG